MYPFRGTATVNDGSTIVTKRRETWQLLLPIILVTSLKWPVEIEVGDDSGDGPDGCGDADREAG